MNKINLMLHAHLPYVRHLDYPRFLEEDWLFESLNESYIPLYRALDSLKNRGVRYKVSICFSPTLITMLQDEPLQSRFIEYMDRYIELGKLEVQRTLNEDVECHDMALHYLQEAEANYAVYESLDRDILKGFKTLAQAGRVELVATAATHAYLPLYKEFPTAIRAQVETGIDTHIKAFSSEPKGFWLPECGYYPGLDEVLAECGIEWCQLPSHSIINSPDKSIYGGYKPVRLPSGLFGFPRDWNIDNLIWSSKFGYPCDPDYREFYRDIGYYLPMDYIRPYIHEPDVRVFTGYKYNAITGKTDEKDFYNIKVANEKVKIHIGNFIFKINRKGSMLAANGIKDPVMNLTFDAELFGHRWFEGISFLEGFLEEAADSDDIKLTTPSEILSENTEFDRLRINEGSWSKAGGADIWLDCSNSWIYHHTYAAIKRMEELTHRFPDQGTLKRRFLSQASREILLAMANDWPCIIHDNTSVSYASKRLKDHLSSFNVVYSSMCRNTVNTEWLIHAEKRDAIFPDIDYTIFDPDR